VEDADKEDEKLKQQLVPTMNFRSSAAVSTARHYFSMETGISSRINANVKNHGLITNLLLDVVLKCRAWLIGKAFIPAPLEICLRNWQL